MDEQSLDGKKEIGIEEVEVWMTPWGICLSVYIYIYSKKDDCVKGRRIRVCGVSVILLREEEEENSSTQQRGSAESGRRDYFWGLDQIFQQNLLL